MENVLVTGGAGFIGSHIVDKLIINDVRVNVLDNLSTGRLSNLSKSMNHKKFRLIKGDLNNSENVKNSLQDVKTVFHMAAHPEVRTGYEFPEIVYKENIRNTFYFLEEIRKSSVETILFASSSTTYGEPTIIPTPENYGPLFPISPYGASKLACEALISSYCHMYGIKGLIFRLANIVGSRSTHGIIWDFINKLKIDNKKLEVLGDGTQSKSFIHVNDCVDCFLFCLSKSMQQFEIFNLGNDDKIDVILIAKIVCDSMNLRDVQVVKTASVDNGRGWIGDVKNMQLDTSKLKHLGWSPTLSTEQAIKLASNELVKEIMTKNINS